MMNVLGTLTNRRRQFDLWFQRAIMLLGAALAAVVIGLVVFILGLRLAYINQALPGVEAAGIDLTGMTKSQIEVALGQQYDYPQRGTIVFSADGAQWMAHPAELGVVVDIPAMAQQAVDWGRQGSLPGRIDQQFDAWFNGHRLSPVVILDQRVARAYLRHIADQFDRPMIEAKVDIQGTQVTAQAGQIGRQVDVPASLKLLNAPIAQLHDAQIGLIVHETHPIVLDPSAAADTARGILSAPLTLTAEGAGPWTVSPSQLAAMLRFDLVRQAGQADYTINIDPQALSDVLEPMAPELERSPENARFIFNDDTHQLDLLKPAVIGRSLDVAGSQQAIRNGLIAGKHEIPLAFHTTDPAVTDSATGEQLGITENVVTVSTYFNGSSPERIQNIKTASSAFHGLLVPPGKTLSMANVLGDISLDTGYAEALIIYGKQTIKGVGGGVCQVSTTLFRAAFFGGYQIVERNPHAYRVLYYEQGPNSPGPGLDATVFVPMVDFKFTNNSPYWLLMETYIYGNQLVWKFYSTSDGRTVDWSSTGPKNVVKAPDPIYKENSDLPKGKIEQVDYQADGMDVTVYRTVTRDGEVIDQDTIKTHYLPWQAVYEYGPGTDLPKGAKTEK
ncbi:MAG: VanW family protein [Anaerolineales bacterium]